jgi:hypothetical protein
LEVTETLTSYFNHLVLVSFTRPAPFVISVLDAFIGGAREHLAIDAVRRPLAEGERWLEL